MSSMTSSGKPPGAATKLPCLYMKQPGGSSNIGFAAVVKLLLAIDCRPPFVRPSSAERLHLLQHFGHLRVVNGISWLTHWL